MKKLNFNIIYDRMHRSTATKPASIEIRFTYGSKQKYISTGVKVLPKEFNDKRRVVFRRNDADELNAILESYRSRATKIVRDMIESGEFDLDAIPGLMAGEKMRQMTFVEYCIKRSETRKVKEPTKIRYRSFTKFLKEWNRIVTFSDLTISKIRELDEYLHKQGYKDATVYTYHKHLKLFIHDAVIDGLVDSNPYDRLSFKISRGEKQYVDCLTQEQFSRLKALTFDNVYEERAYDLFLMQCYTGLAYADLMSFDMECCEETGDGKFFYHAKRKKTDTDFVFQLLDGAMRILIKYNYRLPKLSIQKYNEYLKKIGARIDCPNLHSHMGRATAATTFLSLGMPINIVSRVLGHTSIHQTQRYARTLNSDVKSAFDLINGRI